MEGAVWDGSESVPLLFELLSQGSALARATLGWRFVNGFAVRIRDNIQTLKQSFVEEHGRKKRAR
jgi:hypothetical protein